MAGSVNGPVTITDRTAIFAGGYELSIELPAIFRMVEQARAPDNQQSSARDRFSDREKGSQNSKRVLALLDAPYGEKNRPRRRIANIRTPAIVIR